MSGKGTRGGTFRLGTNRQVELSFKKELGDLTKKSQQDIKTKKESQNLELVSSEMAITKKLGPEFTPQKVREKRKSKPVYHEELSGPKTTNKKPPRVQNVPPYNPLDKANKDQSLTDVVATKKFPYSKPDTITTIELKKPKVSSVGIVPVRSSQDVCGISVLMEGKSAISVDNSAIGKVERANTAALGNQHKHEAKRLETLLSHDESQDANLTPRPAILAGVGTIAVPPFTERGRPPPRPISQLSHKTAGGMARGVYGSLQPGEIVLPDENLYSQYDDAIADIDGGTGQSNAVTRPSVSKRTTEQEDMDDQRSITSQGSVKSVKELLEEARELSKADAVKLYKRPLVPEAGKEEPLSKGAARGKRVMKAVPKMMRFGDKKKGGRGKGKATGDKGQVNDADRSVDEIITALKEQAKAGTMSDSDRRIQEIMSRVMSRTSQSPTDETPSSGEQSALKEDEELSGESSSSQILLSDSTEEVSTLEPSVRPVNEEDETEQGEEAPLPEEPLPDLPSFALDIPPPIESVELDLSSDSDQESEPDLQQAWEDLMAPRQVTREDIVNVTAEQAMLEERRELKPRRDRTAKPAVRSHSISFLSSWKPVKKIEKEKQEYRPREMARNIHHFCTATTNIALPQGLQGVWRKYHTPSKWETSVAGPMGYFLTGAMNYADYLAQIQREEKEVLSEMTADREARLASVATRVLEEANLIQASPCESSDKDTLEAWQARAQEVFDTVELSVEGEAMPLRTDETRLYWTPAPPRMDVPPTNIKSHLFPRYHGAAMNEEGDEATLVVESDEESEMSEESETAGLNPEDRVIRDRLLLGKFGSAEDLTDLVKAQLEREEEVKSGMYTEPSSRAGSASVTTVATTATQESISRAATPSRHAKRQSDLTSISEDNLAGPHSKFSATELRQKFTSQSKATVQEPAQAEEEEETTREMTDDDIFPVLMPIKRTKSCPEFPTIDEDFLLVHQDFNSAMTEIDKQRQQLRDLKYGKKVKVIQPQEPIKESVHSVVSLKEDVVSLPKPETKEPKPTPAEEALQAGRAYVLLPKSSRKKQRKSRKVDMGRIAAMETFLRMPPNRLRRRESFPEPKRKIEHQLRVPPQVRSKRRRSIPDLLDFKEYGRKKGLKTREDTREWVRGIWNRWFDQVFPERPDEDEEEEESEEMSDDDDDEIEEGDKERSGSLKQDKPRRKASVSSVVLSESIEEIEPGEDSEESKEILEVFKMEVERINSDLEEIPNPSAFDLCRRGALYRKLGQLKLAAEDLNQAIQKEPLLVDAYWHRHLLYLLQNKKQAALDDLSFILKNCKTHAGAYRSRAEIFKQQGDMTMTIVNYTQAIKLQPDDYEAYFARAEMYEARGEMLLALEDYAMVTKLMPTKTEALMRHGLYYFNSGNWNNTIQDFTELLRVDPSNSLAYTYRGQAFAELKDWDKATTDLSAGIHLDPNNAVALYHRGCLLRKLHPKRALQDLSVSIIIDDSYDNVNAFLHRGILYNEIGRPEEAIPDFEAVLKLDKEVACAHVNLGLIYMTHYQNYPRAIKKFTSAVHVNPTYVRAYVCRGEAYAKMHDCKNALLDFTRAIHLRPDVHHYYMYRGQMVLRMGNLELASFCIEHASELGSGLGQSPTQQAIVLSFLKNYDKAINVLAAATRQKHAHHLFTLLGKTQMKAQQWKEAAENFGKALELLTRAAEKKKVHWSHREKPWQERDSWPIESAEVHFLIGMCQIEMKQYVDAHEAFNSAIKVNPSYAEAYYQRGLARMRLKQHKGVQDFNKALALNPTIFQAYLSRAAYYGLRGQFSKAILNCNEALKLQPNSVRAYLYRGALKYHIKAYVLAIKDLTKAASIDSQCSIAYFNRAVCFHDSKQYERALQDYGIVLLLGDQLKLKVLINRGLLYFEKKDFNNALNDFHMASYVDPSEQRIHHTLALCYHKLNRLQEAVGAFTMSLERDPFFVDALIGRGNVFMDFGHDAGHTCAKRDYQRALFLDPCCLPAHVNLGYALQVTGRYQQAWRQFTAAITIQPDFKPALEARAIINLQMSDTFAAQQDINASIRVAPSAELYTNRGVVHQFMGDRVNAMQDYNLALKEDPTYALAYFNAANIYFHSRQFKQAKAYFDKAIQFQPKDESACLNRAITKVMLRDAKGALEDFKMAIKLSPHSAHMYFNRANLYASLKEHEKAEKDYTKALELQPDDPLVHKRRADVRGKLGLQELAIEDYRRAIEIQSRGRR